MSINADWHGMYHALVVDWSLVCDAAGLEGDASAAEVIAALKQPATGSVPAGPSALREALERLVSVSWCVATSGGTEGKWCCNHDVPMADDNDCLLVRDCRAALANEADR